jgi:hypothetical protein
MKLSCLVSWVEKRRDAWDSKLSSELIIIQMRELVKQKFPGTYEATAEQQEGPKTTQRNIHTWASKFRLST